jgi:hypothetical protein
MDIDPKVNRIILKEDDVLLVRVPLPYFSQRDTIRTLYLRIKKQLHPRKNKILMLPTEIEISVIGNKEIQEYITNIDLWNLWDENGKEINEI